MSAEVKQCRRVTARCGFRGQRWEGIEPRSPKTTESVRQSQCIPILSRGGFKRLRPHRDGGSRIAAVQNIRASRKVVLVLQSLDGTPQSIHNLASGSAPESIVPSSTGQVRRRLVVVQSSRAPVVDMTACDTEIDHDSNNSAPPDAPPPRVWNEASEESNTDSLDLDGESDTDSLPGSVFPLEEEVFDFQGL